MSNLVVGLVIYAAIVSVLLVLAAWYIRDAERYIKAADELIAAYREREKRA